MHIVTFWLVKRLLKAVHEDELLVQTNRGWFIGRRRLSPEEVQALKAEAKDFRGSYLWNAMKKDVKFMAFLRATNLAKSDMDLIYSGAMYYDLELLEKFIENCEINL